jgi:hypothetical protein
MNSQNVKCNDKEDYLNSELSLETGKNKFEILPGKAIESFLEQECRMKKMPRALAWGYVYITRLIQLFCGCFIFCLK